MICILNVFIIGDINDRSLSDFFIDRLKNNFSVTYINNNLIKKVGNGNEILLFENENLICDNLKDSIIIFKKNCLPEISGSFNKNNTAIIYSPEKEQLKMLCKKNITTITCGGSPKDTITYSSINEDSVVVSLQREVSSIKGNSILPFEIPIKVSECDIYNILSYFALSVKIDCTEKNYL